MDDVALNAAFTGRCRALEPELRVALHRSLARNNVLVDRHGNLELGGGVPSQVRRALTAFADGGLSLGKLLEALGDDPLPHAAPHRRTESHGHSAAASVATVSIHPPGGTYTDTITVHLACSTPGSQVTYTVDGSEPSAQSPVAASALRIEKPAELRARAFVGSVGGPTGSASYSFQAPPPLVNPDGGDHHPPLTVHISVPHATAKISFSVNGEDPKEEGGSQAPVRLNLDRDTTLRVRSFVEAWQPSSIRDVAFRITPPTWRTVEPEDQTDAVPHEAHGWLPGRDGWRLVGASLRGRLHAHRGGWRDDAFALAHVGGWHLLVVADGAGSSPLSRVGARVASDAVRTRLLERLPDLTIAAARDSGVPVPADEGLLRVRGELVDAFRFARSALQAEAERRDVDLAAFSTTLIVVVHRTWQHLDLVASLQVGDGAVAVTGATGLRLLSVVDSGEYAGETRFVTSAGIDEGLTERVRFTLQPGVELVAAMSDGVADDFFPPSERIPELLNRLGPIVGDSEQGDVGLLEWMRYERRGSFDDRTMALLVRGRS